MAALAQYRKEKVTLIIAKLDQLSRNVHLISGLYKSKVNFKAVDKPYANKLMVHLLAAFVEHEREQISIRTKDVLQATKRRGKKLRVTGVDRAQDGARLFAERMRPNIVAIKQQSISTGYP